MSTNSLARNSATNQQFVYRYTKPRSSVENQAIGTLFDSNSAVSGYNSPFVASAAWKMLDLKLTKNTYDGRLEFNFAGSGTLSAICGFTLGIPPLYATHINTIARSVIYGFVYNPYDETNTIWIVHENELTQLANSYTIAQQLSIEINGVEVTYKINNNSILKKVIKYSDADLYVVGACGYNNNAITNVGLKGGVGFAEPTPDWTKEIWVLCNGLTNQNQNWSQWDSEVATIQASLLTKLDIRLNNNTTCKFVYPNETETSITGNNDFQTIPNSAVISNEIPFVCKIVFNNNFNNILGLKIINQLTGTESSITTGVNINNIRQGLVNLQELQIRSSEIAGSHPVYAPSIGRLPLPLQNLKTLVIDVSCEIDSTIKGIHTSHNLEELAQVGRLPLRAPKLSALPKLRKVFFNKHTGLGNTGIVFSGIRELFNPTRTSQTHRLWYYWPPGENNLVPEYFELALAQESATKLLGYAYQGLTTAYHNLVQGAFGYIFNGGDSNYIPNAQLSIGGTHPNQELDISGSSVTIRIPNVSATDFSIFTQYLPANGLILFKLQNKNLNNHNFAPGSSNRQLRLIGSPNYNLSNFTIICSSVSGSTLTVSPAIPSRIPRGTRLNFISSLNVVTTVTTANVVNIGATTITINETNPTITEQSATVNNIMTINFSTLPIKRQSSISCTITNVTSTYVPSDMTGVNYFNLNASNAFASINIGDTVRRDAVSTPISGTPTIVVDKTDANNIVVEKGSVSDGITASNSVPVTVVFNYEFTSNTTEALANPTDYTNNVTGNPATTIISHAFTYSVYQSYPASIAYLYDGVGGGLY